MSQKLTAPIFILGSHKSGSSLLRSLLDGHPRLFVFPKEIHFFQYAGYWVDYRLRAAKPAQLSREQLIERLYEIVSGYNRSRDPYADSIIAGKFNMVVYALSVLRSLVAEYIFDGTQYRFGCPPNRRRAFLANFDFEFLCAGTWECDDKCRIVRERDFAGRDLLKFLFTPETQVTFQRVFTKLALVCFKLRRRQHHADIRRFDRLSHCLGGFVQCRQTHRGRSHQCFPGRCRNRTPGRNLVRTTNCAGARFTEAAQIIPIRNHFGKRQLLVWKPTRSARH